MEIKTSEELESTGYRCLFEGVKQEGIEPFLALTQDIKNISKREILIRQMLMEGKNELSLLEQKHRDIMKYINEHAKEFTGFSFSNENVLSILNYLSENSSPLDLYLENARRLEELKVREIRLITRFDSCELFECTFYRDKGKIINIKKYYTDGRIQIVGRYDSFIPFTIKGNPSFLLKVNNCEDYCQYRDIYITDFAFDGSKLPTEEELQSYEIPKQYILK